MMAKDSVKKRIAGEAKEGMSFTEFTYQLLQGYDFLHLNTAKNCKLQMGGSDQWGNITTGTELIRRKTSNDAFALTCPLITKADGKKFGKTESGNIWLDSKKTSPYKFYQFWLNVSDEDAEKYIKIFTFLTKDEIDNLISEHNEAPHLRLVQKRLAEEITVMTHSREDYEMAIKASNILFGKSEAKDLFDLDEDTLLAVFDTVPQYELSLEKYKAIPNFIDLFSTETEGLVFKSKGEARKMIKGGGVSINKTKVLDGEQSLKELSLIQNKYLLLQKGKKNYYLVKVI